MAKELTKKQRRVLDFIIRSVEKEGNHPTIREIGAKFKMRSTGSVRDVLKALKKKGYIIHDEHVARGYKLDPKRFEFSVTEKY